MRSNVVAAVPDLRAALKAVERVLAEWEHERDIVDESARQGEGDDRPLIVVAGSLYLVSDFLRFLRDEARDVAG